MNWQTAPASGRRAPLLRALRRLHELKPTAPHIVEVGTIRSAKQSARERGGWATRVFGWYAAHTFGLVTSIDPDPDAVHTSAHVCHGLTNRIRYVIGYGQDVLQLPTVPRADLLYLDGPNSPTVQLECFMAAPRPSLLLVDDILDCETYDVKGAEVVPYAMEQGYRLLWCGDRQALLER